MNKNKNKYNINLFEVKQSLKKYGLTNQLSIDDKNKEINGKTRCN